MLIGGLTQDAYACARVRPLVQRVGVAGTHFTARVFGPDNHSMA
jgi:hypothetical protein